MMIWLRMICALWLAILAQPLAAAESDWAETRTMSARLITVPNGIGPGAQTVAAGLEVRLAEGWKTYWRAPGEVGLPPELDWSGSENLGRVDLRYPAPKRFTAFGIENFGYDTRVVFPLQIVLAEADRPLRLALQATLLVCAEICVPETVNLALDLPLLTGVDAKAAALLAEWSAKVPAEGPEAGIALTGAGISGETLVIAARAEQPFTAPDVFPERGTAAAYGAPEIRLSDGGRRLWAALPILSDDTGPLRITITDGARAATLDAPLGAAPPPPGAAVGLWAILGLAILGGLILNVMPCVLPVLTIKFVSALSAAGQSCGRIRAGFLAASLGVLTFFWALAGVLIGLKGAGAAVGWGIQFQNPVFIAVIVALLALFAANLLGLFEFALPSRWSTALARTEARGGWVGDFATGAFAALLATPCSAPFLGTAVTFALSRGALDIVLVFSALGLGLALPYLAVAARPSLVARLPRPGPWMLWVKRAMAGLLALTALWFLSVLAGVGGAQVAWAMGALALAALLALAARMRAWPVAVLLIGGAMALPLALPPAPHSAREGAAWIAFDRAQIAPRVAAGEVVFVDVTADWCLTCKANKTLVLDRGAVAQALAQVTRMQADWTRPDPAIQDFLAAYGRYGIPFNVVYGPGTPQGLPLPELLSAEAVLAALSQAQGPR